METININNKPTTLSITGNLTFYAFCGTHYHNHKNWEEGFHKEWLEICKQAVREGEKILDDPRHPFNQSGKVADIFPSIDISKAPYDELFELREGLITDAECCDGRRKRGKRYQSLLNAICLVTAEFNHKLAEATYPATPEFQWPTDPASYA